MCVSNYLGQSGDMELDVEEEDDGGGGGGQAGRPEVGEEEDVDEGCTLRFVDGMNPLDLVDNDASGVQLYERIERFEYEVLAEKKRKALADNQREKPFKRSRQEDVPGASFDELMEAMNYGGRRKSRKTKKRGRQKGKKNKYSVEVTKMLGDATLLYACGSYKEAINILKEVVRIAPKLPDSYHTLGLVYNALGDNTRALNSYLLAAYVSRKDSALWRRLISMSVEQGNTGLVRYCLSKAIIADPADMTLRSLCASLYIEMGDYQKAAESYVQISQHCPEDIEALKMGSKLYLRCGQVERSISILEDYLNGHPTEYDLTLVDLLAATCMENSLHDKALRYIEHAQLVCCSGKELSLPLTVKSGICHVHLGNMEKAEFFFTVLQQQSRCDHVDLIVKVADSYMTCGHHESALRYYTMLGGRHENGYLHLKIAQCYFLLKERAKAIPFFYKALQALENNIDARLTLASILLEEDKDDDAISLLSPPTSSVLETICSHNSDKPWWLNGEVKLKLCQIYKAKKKLTDFVATIFCYVRDSLYVEDRKRKFRKRKRIPKVVLYERAKLMDDLEKDFVFSGFRPIASQSDLHKAARAKKLLQKEALLKEEKKAAALAAGVDWQSDDSDEEPPRQQLREPPLPDLVKDGEHHHIIIDLSEALVSLQRYQEAFEIINPALKLASNLQLEHIGARIVCEVEHEQGFNYVKRIVKNHPYSLAAWNCYYKVISRPEYQHHRQLKLYLKHSKLLHDMRTKCKDWAPPSIIFAHQLTMLSQHQAAGKAYLEAYKLMPDSPLINLCAGTALINLALGFRVSDQQHMCVVQGLAFLYNNLRLCEYSQESLFNIARAYQHVGLVSLAASYYEKVLATHVKDYRIPKLPEETQNPEESRKQGYCDLRREAAYNLHLIYKSSGSLDLARQVLRDHCAV